MDGRQLVYDEMWAGPMWIVRDVDVCSLGVISPWH